MFKHLLVPLDGSNLAESVLPAVNYLAEKLKASVTLIHVIEKSAPNVIHGQRHLTNPSDAQSYLESIARNSFSPKIKVDFHVHENMVKDVAKSIVEHVGEFAPDMIVLCSHGQTGMRDLLFGSIAQQVISIGKTPVLLIQPVSGSLTDSFRCANILIPVDGNPEHNQSLQAASEIALACQAFVHLMMAIPIFGDLSGQWTSTNKFLPGTTTRMLEMMADEAESYLKKIQLDLENTGLRVSVDTYREDPEAAIIDKAVNTNTDIIVLGTHGKSGMGAFWSGSVTAKVCKATKKPLLLVPVGK